MFWDEVWKVISTVLISAGGTGGLIWYISKAVSKSMFNRYMEEVKHSHDKKLESIRNQYQKEMEETKNQYQIELEKTKNQYGKELEGIKQEYNKELTSLTTRFDIIKFKSNTQYEKEFQIYLEVFENITKVRFVYYKTVSKIKAQKNLSSNMINNIHDTVYNFDNTIIKYYAFIDKDLAEKIENLNSLVNTSIENMWDMKNDNIPFDQFIYSIQNDYNHFYEAYVNLCEDVRNYLNNIKVI